MRFLAPVCVLAFVTALDASYGRFGWSWLAGPVAAAVVWAFDRAARVPAEPEPAPVD